MKDNIKDRTLIDIPAGGNYIEILGYRIDGFESFEAFLEHLKKYVVLEETVKAQKAEVERLQNKVEELSEVLSDTIRIRYAEAKAEAVKEFAERLKEKLQDDCPTITAEEDDFSGYDIFETDEIIDNLVKEMVGDTK